MNVEIEDADAVPLLEKKKPTTGLQIITPQQERDEKESTRREEEGEVSQPGCF